MWLKLGFRTIFVPVAKRNVVHFVAVTVDLEEVDVAFDAQEQDFAFVVGLMCVELACDEQAQEVVVIIIV